MIAKARLYKNTGLALYNSMDSIELLQDSNFDYIDIPDVAIKQERGLVSIKIATTWDAVETADYCVINNSGYWVLNTVMLNDNVALLQIQYDAVTSIGINNIDIIDGWCVRRTYSEEEDVDWYKNTLNEPFTPSNIPFQYDTQTLPDDETKGSIPVVLATIDLFPPTGAKRKSQFYQAEVTGEAATVGVCVPQLQELKHYTVYKMTDFDNTGIILSDTFISGSALFILDNSIVRSELNYAYGINASNTILESYYLPGMYFYVDSDDGAFVHTVRQKLTSPHSKLESVISNNKNRYHNKKVFSGQFLKSLVSSVGSGNTAVYSADSIMPSGGDINQIQFVIIPDARYNGCPVLMPAWYNGIQNIDGVMYGAINGAEWVRSPFVTSKPGGLAQRMQLSSDYASNMSKKYVDLSTSAFDSFAKVGFGSISDQQLALHDDDKYIAYLLDRDSKKQQQGMMNASVGILGNLANMLTYNHDVNTQEKYINAFNSATTMHFMNAPGLISYYGNIFNEVVQGLSPIDMERFDLFLTAFGYAVDEQLNSKMLNNNKTFDFIQANNVIIKGEFNGEIRANLINIFSNGIRIWHTKPYPIKADMNHNIIS